MGTPIQNYQDSVDLDQWDNQDLETRALTIGHIAVRAQAAPWELTEDQWMLYGIGTQDEEAIEFLVQDNQGNPNGIDWREIFTSDAAVAAVQDSHGGHERVTKMTAFNNGAQAHYKGFGDTLKTAGHTVGTLTAVAATAYLAAPALGVGFAWMSKSISGMAIAMGATGWAGSTASMTALLTNLNRTGFSHFAGQVRTMGVAGWVKLASQGTLATSVGVHGVDQYIAETIDVDDIEGFLTKQQQVVAYADLEKAGYTIEVAGQAIGEGEILAIDDPTQVIITDPDGNVLSTDERNSLLTPDAAEAPGDPLVPTTEAGTAPILQGTADPVIFGAAPQWSEPQGAASVPVGGSDLAAIAEQIAAASGGSETAEEEEDRLNPLYGGVSRDYRRTGGNIEVYDEDGNKKQQYEGARTDGLQRFGLTPSVQKAHGSAVYRPSSVEDEMAKWDFMTIMDFQSKAVDAGLINPDSTYGGAYFVPGSMDPFTVRALEGAMAQANRNGEDQTYWDALDIMIEQREKYKELFGDKDVPPTWTPSRAYMAPDYATISQNVKSEFARSLGRDPNGWEMDLLSDQFRSDHKASYDVDMQAERGAFEASGRAQETGEVEIPASGQDIDPIARMGEKFDEQFSDELDAKTRWADVQSKSTNLFGSFDKLANT